MKIKKPHWIDDNSHRAGKRLSNIYWGMYPVWKRDEEVLKLAGLDEELVIYSHTFIYLHRGTEIGRESFKTQGSQNIVYHIPNGYILEDSNFKPKKHGVNRVNVVKEAYTIKFICKHANLATPIEIVIKKPENAKMSVEDARNEIIAHRDFPSGYDIDVPHFTEFPDILTVDNDYTYNVPLKIGNAVPKPIKKVTIKYYLIDDNGDQSIYKTETHRYLAGSYDYIITIPIGYEQTNRVDNDEYNTSVWIKAKIYSINIRLATYKNGNINKVWHAYTLTRKYNETVTQDDLQPFPDNLKVGVAPNLFKVTLRYPDGFVFNTRTIVSDLNIDLEVKASLQQVEIITEVDVPKIEEAGIGVYTYGLPSGEVKPNSIKTVKMKFVANSIGLESGEKAFAVVFPYNPVKQVISGNGYELVTGKSVGISIVKDPNFVHKLKTDFGDDLNGIVNDIGKFETIFLGKPNRATEYSDYEEYTKGRFIFNTFLYVSDNFHKTELNSDRTLKSRWNYRIFGKEFEWTIMDNANITDYDKNEHKCWIIISNIVIHPVPEYEYMKLLEKSIACGLPYSDIHVENNGREYNYIIDKHCKSVHGTLPTIQVYEPFIEFICPLTIKDYRYYLCDNAKDFITDIKYEAKEIENLTGSHDIEGYNRNIIVNDISTKYAYSSFNEDYYIPFYAYNKDAYSMITDKYKLIYPFYTNILKDNPNLYNNKYRYFLEIHKAHNWWKLIYNENLVNSELLPVVKEHETNIVCYNYWDMINHAIAKSMSRTHDVDNKMLTAAGETGKNAVIKVNMHLLPVCIDVEADMFPDMTVAMKEKDFENKVFNDKNPIIVYSPVNVKRIFNNIPRITYFRDPGITYINEYNPFYASYGMTRESDYTNIDFDEILTRFNNITENRYIHYRGDLSKALGSFKKLYKYRPEIYYNARNDELKEVLFDKILNKGTSEEVNLYKLWKEYRVNPLVSPHFMINSKYYHENTGTFIVKHGFDYTFIDNASEFFYTKTHNRYIYFSPFHFNARI